MAALRQLGTDLHNAIPGATSSSYVVQAADAGVPLVVQVTATNGAGSAVASSGLTSPVTSAPANTTQPTITGTPAPGGTLTAAPGSWSGYPAPTFTYQWQRCGKECFAIAGATGATYTVA